MEIELRDIITRSELNAWKEASLLGDDAFVYESMISKWQEDLDIALDKQNNEKERKAKLYADGVKVVSNWAIGTFLACVVLWVSINMIGGCVRSYQTASASEYKKNIESGLFPFGIRTGNNQVKDAPVGVSLASMESEAQSTSTILRYTLNLPILPKNQVYVVAHELIDNDNVCDTGLFYTKPGEYGLSRFEKKVNTIPAFGDFDWLKITVSVVDAGSVPKKE